MLGNDYCNDSVTLTYWNCIVKILLTYYKQKSNQSISSFFSFQTQALALTRPKSPLKDRSRSPSRDENCDRNNDRSPVREKSPKNGPSGQPHHLQSSNTSSNASDHHTTSGGSHHPSNIALSLAANLSVNSKLNSSTSNLTENGPLTRNSGGDMRDVIPDKLLPSPSLERKDFGFSKENGK